MSEIKTLVKPILKEMGLFSGKNISVKKAFEKYLKICPHGIGPLGVFKSIISRNFNLDVEKVLENDKVVDFLFIYKQENDVLYYDPRSNETSKTPL